MKQHWAVFKILMVTAVLATAAGCYEGMRRPPKAGGGGGNSGDGKTGGNPNKRYGVTIVDVVMPSSQTMLDPQCGNIPPSLMDIRMAEIEARIRGLTSLLDAQSDVLRVINDSISPQDCQHFATIERRAITSLPDPNVNDQVKAKPALHVRLVMWYGGGSNGFPSSNVWSNEWADARALKQLGFSHVLSVTEFVLGSTMRQGYVWNWNVSTPFNEKFLASVAIINDPSDSSRQKVMTSVQESTAGFADWLREKVRGL